MVRIIGITGPSCSGKSTVCRALEGEEVNRFSLDNFYKPGGKDGNYDHPEAIKFEEAAKALEMLKKDQEVEIPVFDKMQNEITGERTMEPAQLILVDGFMILHNDEINKILDRSVYLDIGKEEQLKRRIKRFKEGELDTDEKYFHEKVYPAYKKYIEPTKKHADYVIDAERSVEEVIEKVKKLIQI